MKNLQLVPRKISQTGSQIHKENSQYDMFGAVCHVRSSPAVQAYEEVSDPLNFAPWTFLCTFILISASNYMIPFSLLLMHNSGPKSCLLSYHTVIGYHITCFDFVILIHNTYISAN